MKDHIAIIVQKLNGGGAERAAANLSISLSKYYEVHLIVFDAREVKYPYKGMLHDISIPSDNNGIKRIFNVFKRTMAVKRIKKGFGIVASISLMDGANLVNVLSKQNDKVFPSIRIQMSKVPHRTNNGKLKITELLFLRFIERRATKIVAVSKGTEDDLVENCGVARTNVTTIYNMCDSKTILDNALNNDISSLYVSEHSVFTMGRLTKQKGQWHLIRAFAKVIQSVPDAQLYILGNGPLEEALKNLSCELMIHDNVHFLGFVEAPHALICKSRVFVLSSLFEGMSNTILEALACGTPVISTDCESGSREILAPGTGLPRSLNKVEYADYGILTTVGNEQHFNSRDALSEDENQLAEAIISCLMDDELWQRYAVQARIRSNEFSFDTIGRKWKKLIEGNI